MSIARALYARPDLVVADDPLAAVDSVVAKAIFANLCAYARCDDEGRGEAGAGQAPRRGVLLIMNQLNLLPEW